MWQRLYETLGPLGISLVLVALVGLVLFIPFLLFLGKKPLNGQKPGAETIKFSEQWKLAQ